MDNGAVSVVAAIRTIRNFDRVATIYKMHDNIETEMGEGEKKKNSSMDVFYIFSKKQF